MISFVSRKRDLLSLSGCRPRVGTREYHVTVIGSGQMGAGIAQVSAQAGHSVTLVDVKEEQVKKAVEQISKNLKKIVDKKYENDQSDTAKNYLQEVMSRITTTTNITTTQSHLVKETHLVIECAVEKLDIKKQIFKTFDEFVSPKAIFASNTSSLPIDEIATATNRKDRFAGLHFFNPVPIMKLVEIVRAKDTSEDTMQFLIDFTKSLPKTPITCSDTPGFVVNRLLVPYLMDSIRLFERGVATKEDIDTAMKLGAGYPMGPFELSDFVGLDTIKYIVDGWHEAHPSAQIFEPSKLVDSLVAQGKLGKKTGEGFYVYNKK